MKTLTDQQKIEIIKLYESGLNAVQIGKIYSRTNSAILNLLKRRGIIIRKSKPTIYSFNKSTFDIINSNEKAYWLGFLLGDCAVTHNSLRLELSNIDYNHLVKFQNFMQSDNKITNTAKNCSMIIINSVDFCAKIAKYGLVPRKTYLNILTPKINKKYLRHFYRGILDADGWITEHKLKRTRSQHEFGFSSYNMNFLIEIKTWFELQLGKKCGYIKERFTNGQRVCQYIIGGNDNFVKIGKLLYNNANIFLERKFIKYQNFLIDINN